jgi:hypothetical protein
VENRKFDGIGGLTKAHKMFLAAIKQEFVFIMRVIEINFDIRDLWIKSGN